MKTQHEIEEIKSHIQKKIEDLDLRLNRSKIQFEYDELLKEKIRKIAQYNILLEILS